MKLSSMASSVAGLLLATSVTAGTMYVSVKAAVNQESTGQDASPSDANSVPVNDPVLSEALKALQAQQMEDVLSRPELLAPSEVIHGRSQNVMLDADGGFSGRFSSLSSAGTDLIPVENVSIKIMQDGIAVGSTVTNGQGEFRVSGLKPGVAGIIARSESGFAQFGFRLVVPGDPGVEPDAVNPELDVDALLIATADAKRARELILGSLIPKALRFQESLSDADQEFEFGSGPASTGLGHHRVQLNADGTLEGEINVMDDRTGRLREVLDLTVHFLRDGEEVIAAEVENSGKFVVSGLTQGVYSVVGTGKDGTFAVAVDVLGASYEPEADVLKNAGTLRPASVAKALNFSISPISPKNFNSTTGEGEGGEEGPAPPVPPSTPAGGMAGGGSGASGAGGGGAGAGGGGGLGALLAGIAGGIAGYYAGEDNNPASPGN